VNEAALGCSPHRLRHVTGPTRIHSLLEVTTYVSGGERDGRPLRNFGRPITSFIVYSTG
jgi:hypothetical protein